MIRVVCLTRTSDWCSTKAWVHLLWNHENGYLLQQSVISNHHNLSLSLEVKAIIERGAAEQQMEAIITQKINISVWSETDNRKVSFSYLIYHQTHNFKQHCWSYIDIRKWSRNAINPMTRWDINWWFKWIINESTFEPMMEPLECIQFLIIIDILNVIHMV